MSLLKDVGREIIKNTRRFFCGIHSAEERKITTEELLKIVEEWSK